jgi:hypothetical protein
MPVPDFSPGEVLTAAAMDSIGLWLVGSVNITGTPSSVNGPANCFSSTYDHYRISISNLQNSTGSQLRLSFPGVTTGYYFGTPLSATAGGAFASNSLANTSFIDLGNIPATWLQDFTFDILAPNKPTRTKVTGFGYLNSISFGGLGDGIVNSDVQFTSFTLTASSGTFSAGTIQVFGYRKP